MAKKKPLQILPLGDRVLLKVSEVQQKLTEGGLHIPDNVQETKTEGEVIAVGPDVEMVKVGQTALFGKYAGTQINQTESKEYSLKLMREDELLAILVGG